MSDSQGKPFDPLSLPREEADDEQSDLRDAPIGRPMSPAEYARAKGEAGAALDAPRPSAQEDADD